jgi:hypothetical protein
MSRHPEYKELIPYNLHGGHDHEQREESAIEDEGVDFVVVLHLVWEH